MDALILSGGAAHGAFQAGTMKAIEESSWSPDLICGTSVGAINGAGFTAGLSGEELVALWESVSTSDVYRWRPARDWLNILQWKHFFDTSPLESFLRDNINLSEMDSSEITNLCFATNVRTGDIQTFSNYPEKVEAGLEGQYGPVDRMNIRSVLGSASIPGVFPWVDGFWDGSFRLHAPLRPAVVLGAESLVIVHIGFGADENKLPDTLPQTAMKILEIASNHRYKYDLRLLRNRNHMEDYRYIPHCVISPVEDLGYSKLDFDSSNKSFAIRHGYEQAKRLIPKEVSDEV